MALKKKAADPAAAMRKLLRVYVRHLYFFISFAEAHVSLFDGPSYVTPSQLSRWSRGLPGADKELMKQDAQRARRVIQRLTALTPSVAELFESHDKDSALLYRFANTWRLADARAALFAAHALASRLAAPAIAGVKIAQPANQDQWWGQEKVTKLLDVSLAHLGRLVNNGVIRGEGKGKSLICLRDDVLYYQHLQTTKKDHYSSVQTKPASPVPSAQEVWECVNCNGDVRGPKPSKCPHCLKDLFKKVFPKTHG